MNYDLTDPEQAGAYYAEKAKAQVEREFVARHPELLNVEGEQDAANRQIIYGLLNLRQLPITPENLEACFQEAARDGQLSMPMYSVQEQTAFSRMSAADIAEHLNRRYQAPAPGNAAEFLMTSGGRAKDTIMSTRGQK
jgi:hypothetical protein